jgi:hypothetical protein
MRIDHFVPHDKVTGVFRAAKMSLR